MNEFNLKINILIMENKILIKTETINRIDVIYNKKGIKPHVHIYSNNDSFIINFNDENQITLFLNTINSSKPPIFLEVTKKELINTELKEFIFHGILKNEKFKRRAQNIIDEKRLVNPIDLLLLSRADFLKERSIGIGTIKDIEDWIKSINIKYKVNLRLGMTKEEIERLLQ